MNNIYSNVEISNINNYIQNLSIFENKLEIIKCLHSTSKRAIYKVKDLEFNKICIAKFIIKDNISKKTLEILNLIKKNKHKNINSIYEIGEINSFYVILCEYIEGKSLKEFIQNNTNLKDFEFVFNQILEGIKFLHTNNIIHSDIKPSNIIVNDNLDVKLIDFDSSILLKKKNSIKLNLIIGTPPFIAPEILNNKTYYYKSDLWSLGSCIIYCINKKNRDFSNINIDILEKRVGKKISLLIKDMIKEINNRPDIKMILEKIKN